MRCIGNLDSEDAAVRFSDCLFVRGIENQFDAEDDGTFSFWVMEDEQIPPATALLAQFRADPSAPDFAKVFKTARQRRREQRSAETERRSTTADHARLEYERNFEVLPYVTWMLIVVSVAVAIFSQLGDDKQAMHFLYIADIQVHGEYVSWRPGLLEVRAGQIWRLITPIFIHLGLPHIVFNLFALNSLGPMVERRFSGLYLVVLVVFSSVLSNLGQFVWAGPMFGGMSGVIYALFGFIWIRGKCDPRAGLEISTNLVVVSIAWFLLCAIGWIPYVANVCHAVGLAVGMSWGWLSSKRLFSR
jgi:GlpG protein